MRGVGEEVLRRPPVQGAWTPLQTLHHIHLVERVSVDYLLYKLDTGAEAPPTRLAERLRGKVVVAALMSPVKFKAPEETDSRLLPKASRPDIDQLAYELFATRGELERLINKLPPSWNKGAAFKHVSGRMSLNDMMLFLLAHQHRHTKQIKRGLAQNTRYYRRKKAR